MTDKQYSYILKKGEFDYVKSCLLMDGAKRSGTEDLHTIYLYDTADFDLKKSGITCYLRDGGGEIEGVVRLNTDKENREVYEFPIDVKRVDEKIYLKGRKLELKGTVNIFESKLKLKDGCVLYFNINTYLFEREYEIKTEFLPESYMKALNLKKHIAQLVRQYRLMSGICDGSITKVDGDSLFLRFSEKKENMISASGKPKINPDFIMRRHN